MKKSQTVLKRSAMEGTGTQLACWLLNFCLTESIFFCSACSAGYQPEGLVDAAGGGFNGAMEEEITNALFQQKDIFH